MKRRQYYGCCYPYANWSGQGQIANLKAASLNERVGYYLNTRGHYADAEQLLRHALTIREQLLGPEHLDVAVSLYGLGAVLVSQGKYTEAEALCLRALELALKIYGSEHPTIATIFNNLALLYERQDRLIEATALCTSREA